MIIIVLINIYGEKVFMAIHMIRPLAFKMPPMAFGTGRIWNMYTLLFWIIFLYPNPLLKALGNETSRRCRHFSTTESFEVGNTKGQLLEVHLRQNVRVRTFPAVVVYKSK